MRKLFIILVLIVGVTAIFAQNPVAKGQAQINAGIGLSGWGKPIYLGFDYGVHRDITMGAEASFNLDNSVVGVSGNINYHFNSILNIPTNWDFYAGANLGYYYWTSSENHTNHTPLHWGGQIGGRYYFTENVGINLEFGGGNAFNGGKLGVSIKL